MRADHPEWDETQLQLEVTHYVAPPTGVPPHSTGGAFDLTLVDAEGKALDMGTAIDDISGGEENRNYTEANSISDQAKQNRRILINVLTEVGFVNYPTEWWHWSYGDKYWAFNTDAEYALYGSVQDSLIQT